MKRAILSRLQPFLAWPRGRSEAAIKGWVTMNDTFQWKSIRHGGFGGMQVPGGSSQPQVGLQGAGWCRASPQDGDGAAPSLHPDPPEVADAGGTFGCTPGLRGISRVLRPFGGEHGDAATQGGRRGWCRGRGGERVWLQPRGMGYTHILTASL